jgi:hypothetical protein
MCIVLIISKLPPTPRSQRSASGASRQARAARCKCKVRARTHASKSTSRPKDTRCIVSSPSNGPHARTHLSVANKWLRELVVGALCHQPSGRRTWCVSTLLCSVHCSMRARDHESWVPMPYGFVWQKPQMVPNSSSK